MALFFGVALTAGLMLAIGSVRTPVAAIILAIAFAVGALERQYLPTLVTVTPALTLSSGPFLPSMELPKWLAGPFFVVYASWALCPLLAVYLGPWSSRSVFVVCFVVLVGYFLTGAFEARAPWSVEGYRFFEQFPPGQRFLSADTRPSSAFPSMHVALPYAFAVSLNQWWLPYTVLIATVVVVSGEHWIADVVGSFLLVNIAGWCYEWSAGARVPWSTGERQNVLYVSDGVAVVEGKS